MGLGHYKWYQRTDDLSTRKLSPKGGGHEGVCSEDVGPLRGADYEISHHLERRTKLSL